MTEELRRRRLGLETIPQMTLGRLVFRVDDDSSDAGLLDGAVSREVVVTTAVKTKILLTASLFLFTCDVLDAHMVKVHRAGGRRCRGGRAGGRCRSLYVVLAGPIGEGHLGAGGGSLVTGAGLMILIGCGSSGLGLTESVQSVPLGHQDGLDFFG